jgi:uncharacterized protein (UPF0548 family)
MDDDTRRRLAAQAFTYAELGASLDSTLPDGYDHLSMSRVLGHGRDLFDAAARRLMTWGMHAGAGLTVSATDDDVRRDGLVLLGVRIGLMTVKAPCRVVQVVDEPDRRGFAYGTLVGHPECGEEAFVVQIAADGQVSAVVTAFSRPAWLAARLVGPLGRMVQVDMARAYLDALSDSY